MTEANSEDKNPKGEPRLNRLQYQMLLRCSEKKDITKWNEWRKANPGEDIWLQGAHLAGAYLEGAHLEGADLHGAHLEGADLKGAHLEGADLSDAHLEDAHFGKAAVNGSTLIWGCSLNSAV